MTERQSDIEFDFFDEPATEEAPERHRIPRRAPRPGGPRRPVRPPAGLVPLLRLAGLVAFVILLVVLLVVAINGCQSSSKEKAYSTYLGKVQGIATRSTQIGRDLSRELARPGVKENELETTLDGLAQQQQQGVTQAQTLEPPGPLRTVHTHLIEALQLRASGLGRLADAFRQTVHARNANATGRLLAQQAQLLTASDVNWDFYFREPARDELKAQGVTGVTVADSNFVVNPDLASVRSMVQVFQRIHGASTGGTPTGVHGTGLVGVRVLPSGQTLNTTSNTITASTDLAFEVSVKDTGEAQEVQIPVVLTIQSSGAAPVVRKQTIGVINVGETKKVIFRSLPQPQFGAPSQIKVSVQPVPGEQRKSNNSAQYPAIFSLG
jgi:hypothetical protein